jgi:nucleotide-binding universal stress UspA family protein
MVAKVKNVLFPIDFSRYHKEMLNYAYELAQILGAQLHVIYNIDPVLRYREYRALGYRNLDEETIYLNLYEKYYGELKEVTKTLTGVGVNISIEKGVTYKNIIKAAAKYNADIIVMGSHGDKSADYTELGVNARKVVSFAPCSVLVIKPQDFIEPKVSTEEVNK